MPTWESTSPYDPYERRPFQWTATTGLMLAHTIGFFVTSALQAWAQRLHSETWVMLHAKDAILKLRAWQFLTYGFTGDLGSIWTFLIFMLMMWWFVRPLEGHLGARKLLIVYVGGLFYGGLIQCVYQLASGTAGYASGFMFPGYHAALMMLAMIDPHRTLLFFFIIRMKLIVMVGILFLIDLYVCIIGFHPGYAPFASVGATVFGYLMYKWEPRFERWLDRREAMAAMRDSRKAMEVRRRVDALLSKISDSGMGSLSDAERRFLERASDELRRGPD